MDPDSTAQEIDAQVHVLLRTFADAALHDPPTARYATTIRHIRFA